MRTIMAQMESVFTEGQFDTKKHSAFDRALNVP